MSDLEQLKAAIDSKMATNPEIRYILKLISSGKASLDDSAKYAQILSHILGQELASEILELSDREDTTSQLLHGAYDDVNDVYSKVQTALDKKAGIAINPKRAPFPVERVKQFAHSLVDPTVEDSVIKRRARAGSETITKSFHDDCIETNAKFRDNAGMKSYVIRQGSNCCDFCSRVEGKYRIGNQPDDFFGRHDNCDCTIIYDGQVLRGQTGAEGKRGKKWVEIPEGAGASLPTSYTPEQARLINDKKTRSNKYVVDKSLKNGIIKEKTAEMAGTDVHKIGNIDINIYKCVTKDIITDEVIITDERIKHIKDNHPNDFELYCKYMKEIVESPDYIIQANKEKTALILKSFEDNSVPFKTILRLVTSTDNPKYKNSIITFMKIDDKEWNRLIKNKKVLYKSE